MTEKKVIQGHLLAFMTIIIWGTTFISTKILLRDFTPVTILFIRFTMGFIFLFLLYPKRLVTSNIKQEVTFAMAGLCGVTLYFLLENIALTYSLASNVGVVVSIAPFFTALFAHKFLHGERIKNKFLVGFLIAIIGIACISFNGSSVLKLNPLGDILAIIAAIVWAVYSILTTKIGEYGYNTIQTTRRIFFYGLMFMIPALFLLPFDIQFVKFTKAVNVWNLLYLGIGASALCFATWNTAVKLLGAVKTSVYIYLVPVITVITSLIVLKEKFTWISVVGTILTVLGLLISEGKEKSVFS